MVATRFARLLGGMIDAKTQMHSRVVKALTVGGIAQLYKDFEGTTVDASGKTIAIHHKAIEVLRHQPLAIGSCSSVTPMGANESA